MKDEMPSEATAAAADQSVRDATGSGAYWLLSRWPSESSREVYNVLFHMRVYSHSQFVISYILD